MYKAVVAAAAVLLTSASLCFAQPPGITREMIERALFLESAPLAEPEPYAVTSESAFESPGHLASGPTALDAFAKQDKLPIMVCRNGGCAIGMFNSGAQRTEPGAPASPIPLTKFHGPALMMNGHELDFMMPQSAATFEPIDNLPVFYAARPNTGHIATVFHPGGELADVAWHWLEWTVKGDQKAGATSVRKNCSRHTNSNRDVKSKGIKE